MSMKRVLIITYYWPPSGGSGVQRWVKFSKYLPSQGWQPVIYTPENPDMPSIDQSLYSDIPGEAEIIKRPITEIYSIYRRISGNKGGGEVNPINSQKKTLKQKLMLAIRGNLFIPDPRISWLKPSVRFLKKYLREHPVDVIVSTGPPHSMHLIAREVSKATGIPWVADFRDPWTRMFYFKHLALSDWARKKHEKLEKMVLDDASAVVAVSPLVQEEFKTMTGNRIELVTNGYDPEDFGQVVEPDGHFNIVHTGLFASDGNPETLWKVLSDLCREDARFADQLRIRLVGKNDTMILDSIHAAGLERNLVDLGYRDHTVAVREQMGSTMLILPLRKEPEYRATLPGKLFEYLGSQRPVLGIGQTDGAMARILADTGAGETFEWDDEAGIRTYVLKRWEKFLAGDDDSVPDNNIEQYSRKATARKMAALLESLID
ncbi:Glycosyltransferase involved in cell wall bisynthesis [Bacteroidales bacterium WCE2008]|nr:Glycosyltransferase involved in cell wall bisynthesis [Bacteroidales bacterium WCE2008]